MPSIALIGRQNVGKSSLFNALLGRKHSIIYDMPGVTRDMVKQELDWSTGLWTLTDFPGFEKVKALEDKLEKTSIERGFSKLKEHQLLLLVVHRSGLNPFEENLIRTLQRDNLPFWILINFLDDPSLEGSEQIPAYSGIPRFFVSGLNKRGLNQLKTEILRYFSGDNLQEENLAPPLKVSILGKPNAGKSQLFNQLCGNNIALVSDIAGTTRDVLSETLAYHKRRIKFLDTAGLKRRDNRSQGVDFYSITRAKSSISEANLALLVVDCVQIQNKQNRRLLELLESSGKPTIVLVNKIDQVSEEEFDLASQRISEYQNQFWTFPVIYISALTGKNCNRILSGITSLVESIPDPPGTPKLNQYLRDVLKNPILQSHNIKLNYAVMDKDGKKIIVFGNKKTIPSNIQKYLVSAFRKKLNWTNIPLRLEVRHKQK
jgi:GTPase